MNNYFLDTTIQIDRITEDERKKKAIEAKTKGKNLSSCSLVLREFKERLINYSIVLLELVKDSKNRADLLTRISNQYPPGPQIITKIYAQLIRDIGVDLGFNKELLLETLRLYIEGHLEERFFEGIAELVDTTKCELAREEISIEGDLYKLRVGCNKKNCHCKIHELVENNIDKFALISKGVENSKTREERRELAKIAGIYYQYLNTRDKKVLMGRNCNRISDMIIALEAPEGYCIYSTDKDYDYLRRVLGICLEREAYDQ